MSGQEQTSSSRVLQRLSSNSRGLRLGSISSSAQSESASTETLELNKDDIAQSTRQNLEDDSHCIPKLRDTAQKHAMPYYHPQEPTEPVQSSARHHEFPDFDHSFSSSEDESQSIEIGRGYSRNTPIKNSAMMMDMDSAVYEVTGTPPTTSRPRHGHLRRDAVVRSASNKHSAAHSRPLEANSTSGAGNTGELRSRTRPRISSANVDSPRNTMQSFMLPDLPNITELVVGTFKDGTPIFSRTTKPFPRLTPNKSRTFNQPNFVSVNGVAIPEEEKIILASLQLLKDKVALLEENKAQSDVKIEDYENALIGLRAQLDAQTNMRRSDSALGSTDGESVSKESKWLSEKSQLQTLVQTLQKRLERAERKIATAETKAKRLTNERDSIATQIGVAFLSSEELKTGFETVQNENRLLQDQVTDLQAENRELIAEIEELRTGLDETRNKHEEETQRWAKKEASLTRKVGTTDRAIHQENQTLREQLARAKAQQEDEDRVAAKKEAEIRRRAEQAAKAEYSTLVTENERLKRELDQAKADRVAELKRWAEKRAKLEARVERQEETLHHINSSTPQLKINEDLRAANTALKVELAKLKADASEQDQGTPKAELRRRLEEVTSRQENETKRWSEKEQQLQSQLSRAQEFIDLNQQLNDINSISRSGAEKTSRLPAELRSKRKSERQFGVNNQDGIPEQVEREMQKNRSLSAAKASTVNSKSRIRSKSQTRQSHPHRNFRLSSAPIVLDEDESDASTTDLSFDAVETSTKRTDYLPAKATAVHTDDITYLSWIDGNEIARLRKTLEEAHAAARRSKDAQANSTPSLTQKSSLKDLTGRSKASSTGGQPVLGDDDIDEEHVESENEAQQTKQDTARSGMSSASRISTRRRAGAFAEMTSAFIIPDITLDTRGQRNDTARSLLDKLAPVHDTRSCTVCQRIIGTSLPESAIPTPVPVSTRAEVQSDIDATMRPSQEPVKALAQVMKQLQDELTHLKLELHVYEQKLQSADASIGKRVRTAIQEKLLVLIKAIEVKGDQIYSLYDVLEAHKDDLVDGVVCEEVERTMESLRNGVGRAGGVGGLGGKKVAFGKDGWCGGDGGDGGDGDGDVSSDVDAAWAGISDTESLHMGRR